MNGNQRQQVTASHLAREAYVYIRQAVLCEGIENSNALQQQYNLRQHALALGWPAERVMVIDSDVGHSGVSRTRAGFQELLRRIKQGRVGIVLALEPSRLTRSPREWQHLMDACALNDTLVLQQKVLLAANGRHEVLWAARRRWRSSAIFRDRTRRF